MQSRAQGKAATEYRSENLIKEDPPYLWWSPADTTPQQVVTPRHTSLVTASTGTIQMRRTRDYVRTFRGRLSGVGRCRVRIYETETGVESSTRANPVVICTELPGGGEMQRADGPSVADAAKYLAAEVIEDHCLAANAPQWIEHCPAHEEEGRLDRWAYVVFAHYVPEEVLAPGGIWRRRIGQPARASLDRQTVEALVGEPV